MKIDNLDSTFQFDPTFYPDDTRNISYPALQVDTYEPKLKDDVVFVIDKQYATHETLSCDIVTALKLTPIDCEYKSGSKEMLKIATEVRWVILNNPEIYYVDKITNKVQVREYGMSTSGTNLVTLCKLFLACVVDGKLLTNDNLPQVFTLKLKSTNTSLITCKDPEQKTLYKLNKVLSDITKTPNKWLLPLVSVNIRPTAVKRVSKTDSKLSSVSVQYDLEGNALLLAKDNQKIISGLLLSDNFKKIVNDPFYIKGLPKEEVTDSYLNDDVDF